MWASMEKRLREFLHEVANQYNFSEKFSVDSMLNKKKRVKNRKRNAGLTLAILTLLVFTPFIGNIKLGFADLVGSDLEDKHSSHGDYLVHDKFYYIDTNNFINKSELGREIDHVKRVGDWNILKEGDTSSFTVGSKYYEIKGVAPSKKIAIEIPKGRNDNDIVDYKVLGREKAIEKVNEKVIYSAKSEEEIVIALKNINKVAPAFYKFDLQNYELTEVSLKSNGKGFLINSTYKEKNNDNNYIFMRQYEIGTKLDGLGTYDHDPLLLEKFSLMEFNWEQYKSEWNNSYFLGTKENIVIEISSQNIDSKVIKETLVNLSK